jgi:DNA invertase Pin-like site-specific DNA recombinase
VNVLAAVYARKSTDQLGLTDEQKSVTRQVEHARVYAERKGWAVADEFVFVDDAVSGAEFATRPGFVALMASLKPRPRFQVLVMAEESRLGREQIEVAYALKQLAQAGVRVWLYLEDRERTLDSPTDKLLMSVTAFADELEREKARQRTYDALARKARSGHVTGGVVFGYRNREVVAGDGRRQYVEREINPDEVDVVRRIFERCAAGVGVRRIAITLNDEGAPAPTPRRSGRPRSWAPSSVREVLYRDLYRGVVIWNRIRKRDVWGLKRYLARPEDQWMRRDAPELRIVDDALWTAAHRRLEESRASYLWSTNGKLNGRAPAVKAIDSKYLLTGFAQCGVCGGSLMARSRDYGSRRKFTYLCGYHHQRGRTVCVNGLEAPMDGTDHAVLTSIERDLLRSEVVERAIGFAINELRGATAVERRREQILAEMRRLDAELARLTTAIASGGDLPALLAALKERQVERERYERVLLEQDVTSRIGRTEIRRLEVEIRQRLVTWQAMLRREVPESREILRNLVVGQIVFTPRPEARVYEFSGRGRSGVYWREPPVQCRW